MSLFAFFGSLIAVWVFGVKYMRKKYLEFNQVPVAAETPKSSKTKPGRYVNVDELSKSKKTTETAKKEKNTSETKSSGVQLDDLLEKDRLEKDAKK
jgi:hypothetical protein